MNRVITLCAAWTSVTISAASAQELTPYEQQYYTGLYEYNLARVLPYIPHVSSACTACTALQGQNGALFDSQADGSMDFWGDIGGFIEDAGSVVDDIGEAAGVAAKIISLFDTNPELANPVPAELDATAEADFGIALGVISTVATIASLFDAQIAESDIAVDTQTLEEIKSLMITSAIIGVSSDTQAPQQ